MWVKNLTVRRYVLSFFADISARSSRTTENVTHLHFFIRHKCVRTGASLSSREPQTNEVALEPWGRKTVSGLTQLSRGASHDI